jgi:hypothetical protein
MMVSREVVCSVCVISMEMSSWSSWKGWVGDPVEKEGLKQLPGRSFSLSWWMIVEMIEGMFVLRLV